MEFEGWIAMGGSLGTVLGAGWVVRAGVREREDKIWLTAFLVGLGLWWMAVVVAAWQGWFQATAESIFPRILVGWTPVLLLLALWLFLPSVRRIGHAIPPAALVGVQAFRLVGLAMLWSGWKGDLPLLFAVPAGLGGVFTGVTAPVVALAVARRAKDHVKWTKLWNLLGLADIAVAMVLGGLTGPGPNQILSVGFPSGAATGFPLVVTPAFLVPLALLGHFLSLRSIARRT